MDRMCEITTKAWQYPRNDTWLLTFAGNQNMGNKMEKNNWQNKWMGSMATGECEDKQRKSYITKTNCKHSEGGYGKLPLHNIYTCHGIF